MNAPPSVSLSESRYLGWRPERCDRVALVLQGGGALGAYQAGVYQALHEADIEPDWISGVSIGAINSALIAGNPRERRLERLKAFWDRITDRKVWWFTPEGDLYRQARNATSSFFTTLLGQPGFFEPRRTSPLLAAAGATDATSFYDTKPLRETLLELVDFDLINRKEVRFSVGAVNAASGNFVYFDNAQEAIGPEHVMASGALPPAFPTVQIGTEQYWDGGLVSNTPLQHLLAQDDTLNSLIFQVDLFSARGALPRTMQDVMGRQKDITYSSRTRLTTDLFALIQNWKKKTHQALTKVPEGSLSEEERTLRDELALMPEHTILQLIYQQKSYEGHAKDYEFSRTSMQEHWKSGYEDTRQTLTRKDWLRIPPDGAGIVAHDVHRDFERR
ncbi:patatin-like phospholipase family protein [Bosea psychrotolerans]|uniref:NTE family protein n=1 Tax=Bosea psychrotolerans TaxID=1871628 RepID=A0A2S4MBM6_9HYPH|nr:patatin-like phospholipase family protein [Bosea psychrotolerans]POR52019.1 NTE family protein [Bosea psychrotolerans]